MRAFASVLLLTILTAGVFAAFPGLHLAPLHAQQRSATLIVFVSAAGTGQPLRGAQLLVDGTSMWGITNEQGMLRLAGLPTGSKTLQVRRLGYRGEQVTVQLREGRATELSFALDVQPIALAGIRVAAAPVSSRQMELNGFEGRRARGFGTFITREQIERRQPLRLSDVLRNVPGIQLSHTAFSDSRASMARSSIPTRRCPIQYYVDGVQVIGFNIDDVRPHDIEGIEIYKGASEIPPTFNRGTAMCGVIVLWTRVARR